MTTTNTTRTPADEGLAAARADNALRYEIKCDDCKTIIGRTDSVGRSAQGGRCDECAA